MSLLKVLVLVATWMIMVEAQQLPELCSTCECLTYVKPFVVDCKNMEYKELPDMTSLVNISTTWMLTFENNMITKVTNLIDLHDLISLSFRKNNINWIASNAFKDLRSLTHLDLSYNNLTVEALDENVFQGEYNENTSYPLYLTELDLSYNNLYNLKDDALRHLPYLKKLILGNNPLNDISFSMAAAITELKNLQELDLSQTKLSRLPPHFLTDLTSLQVLTLAGNKFTMVPSELNFGRGITKINFNNNPIKSITKGDFASSLATVEVLELTSMKELLSVGAGAFSSMTSLRTLHLSNNPKLGGIHPRAFLDMDGEVSILTEIYLENNALTQLSETMLPWLELQRVNVQNNPWSCNCNLKWMAETLIPDVSKKNPGDTLSVMCAEPVQDRGQSVVNTLQRSGSYQCTSDSQSSPSSLTNALLLGTIMIGVVLLLTGTVMFAFALYRRSKGVNGSGDSVKYRRFASADQDSIYQPTVTPE